MDKSENCKLEWMPCAYTLIKNQNSKPISINLAPVDNLADLIDEKSKPEVKVSIEMEKPLIYSEDLGWNWHKSWNLPPIMISVEIHDLKTGIKLTHSQKLYAEVFAVKAVFENMESFHLIDTGLKGENKIKIQEGRAYFNSLKFASTSYNNDSAKFHLVICLSSFDEKEISQKILNSFISSPIFVDSRKSARDAQKIKAKKISLHIDPFLPDNLEKIFIKRQNKKRGTNHEEITNNLDGLMNYFTAPNIRHKVKHPLFLAIKFSNCIGLYCNKDIIPEDNSENLIECLQNILYESQIKHKYSKNLKLEEKPFILALRYLHENNSYENKKIIEQLETVNSNIIHIVYDIKIIPKNFSEISNIVRNYDVLLFYLSKQIFIIYNLLFATQSNWLYWILKAQLKDQYKKQYSKIASSKFKLVQSLKHDGDSRIIIEQNKNVKEDFKYPIQNNEMKLEINLSNKKQNSEYQEKYKRLEINYSTNQHPSINSSNQEKSNTNVFLKKTQNDDKNTKKTLINNITKKAIIVNDKHKDLELEPKLKKELKLDNQNKNIVPKTEFEEKKAIITLDNNINLNTQNSPQTLEPLLTLPYQQNLNSTRPFQQAYPLFPTRPFGFINPIANYYPMTNALSNEELLLFLAQRNNSNIINKSITNFPMGSLSYHSNFQQNLPINPKIFDFSEHEHGPSQSKFQK